MSLQLALRLHSTTLEASSFTDIYLLSPSREHNMSPKIILNAAVVFIKVITVNVSVVVRNI
jgi:hypothetical protein